MVDALRLDVANLVGLIMQSFCYGVFQVLFIACIYVLVYGRKTDSINWHFVITACLMWLLIGLNFALSWSRIMDSFIELQPTLRSDPDAITKYFADLTHWKEVTRTICYLVLTAVADSLFIYRLYVVWSRSIYIILLPAALLAGTIISGVGLVVVLWQKVDIFSASLAAWITTFLSCSLVQNLLTTFFIVYRIWRVNASMQDFRDERSLWPVMVVILESGAIYSGILSILLATYAAGSFYQYIALDVLVPMIGVVFNLIIVRVGLGLSKSPSRRDTASTRNPGNAISEIRFPMRTLRSSTSVPPHVTGEHGGDTISSTSVTKIKYTDSDTEPDPNQWKEESRTMSAAAG